MEIFSVQINLIFEYSVLNKIRLDCNVYPSPNPHPSPPPPPHTHAHTPTPTPPFTYIISLPQKQKLLTNFWKMLRSKSTYTHFRCLIFINSNLSLIQNKYPSPNFLIFLKLLTNCLSLFDNYSLEPYPPPSMIYNWPNY